jgi:ABC-2 type transport system ATP-binding protein
MHGLGAAETRRRIEELCALLGASEIVDRPAASLSLGQRMRCEIMAALIHRPRLLFLDEPTVGLDLLAKQALRDHISWLLRDQQVSLILTSHDAGDIEQLVQRVVVLDRGSKIFDGDWRQLYVTAPNQTNIFVKFEEYVPSLPQFEGVNLLAADADSATLCIDEQTISLSDAIRLVMLQLPVTDISVSRPSLEVLIREIYLNGEARNFAPVPDESRGALE